MYASMFVIPFLFDGINIRQVIKNSFWVNTIHRENSKQLSSSTMMIFDQKADIGNINCIIIINYLGSYLLFYQKGKEPFSGHTSS